LEGLQRWRDRVGEAEAKRIMIEASTRGTEMHYVLENYIEGKGYINLSEKGNKARLMAHKIVENLGALEIEKNKTMQHYKAALEVLEKTKQELESKYGAVNINLKTGVWEEVEVPETEEPKAEEVVEEEDCGCDEKKEDCEDCEDKE